MRVCAESSTLTASRHIHFRKASDSNRLSLQSAMASKFLAGLALRPWRCVKLRCPASLTAFCLAYGASLCSSANPTESLLQVSELGSKIALKLAEVKPKVLRHCHSACLNPCKCRSPGPKVPRTRNILVSVDQSSWRHDGSVFAEGEHGPAPSKGQWH